MLKDNLINILIPIFQFCNWSVKRGNNTKCYSKNKKKIERQQLMPYYYAFMSNT